MECEKNKYVCTEFTQLLIELFQPLMTSQHDSTSYWSIEKSAYHLALIHLLQD